MKNEQNTQDNTQENRPKRGRPHKKSDEFVFGRRISGTAKFWEGLDWLVKDSSKTIGWFLNDMVLNLYAATQPIEFDDYQVDKVTHVDKPKIKETNKPKDNPAKASLPFSTLEFEKAWSDWVLHRKEKKHTLTSSTASKQLKMLGKLGEFRAIQAIENSILHGYQGLFESGNHQKAGGQSRRPQTADMYGI